MIATSPNHSNVQDVAPACMLTSFDIISQITGDNSLYNFTATECHKY